MKFAFFIMTIFTLIDQGSKILVRAYVEKFHMTPLIPNFLELTYVENKGVSFSFLANLDDMIRLPLLITISSVAVVGMLYYLIRYWDSNDIYMRVALIWILPGAIGNLIDRAIFGSVTDFLHFRWYEYSFFVNNLADCFISVGVVFFILSTFWGQQKVQKKVTSSTSNS